MPWGDSIPETVTVEQDGRQVPLRGLPLITESPDIGHFAKRAFDMHSELGRRIPVTAKSDADKETWRKEHLPKLYQAGILEAPPSSPEAYDNIKRPDLLPEGLVWSEERAKNVAKILHKYGVPKSAVPELLEAHTEALLGLGEGLKTHYDTTMAALKAEHGDKFDERQEMTKRLTKFIFKTPEEVEFFDRTGMADHPVFNAILMRLAPFAQQDSSFIAEMNRGGGGGGLTGDEVRARVADIMTNKQNPKYAAYWRQDPVVMKEIDDWYKEAYGTGQVTISG